MLLVNALITDLANEEREYLKERVDERYTLATKVLLGAREPGNMFKPMYEAWGDDLSNTGLGLLTTKRFESGVKCYMVMRLPKRKPIFAKLFIRRCIPLTSTIYKLGTTFIYDDEKNPTPGIV